jgi:membrane protein
VKKTFTIFKDILFRFKDDAVPSLAAQLAYSLLSSLFPFLIFLMTLAPFLNVSIDEIVRSIQSILPEISFKLVKNIVSEVLNTKSTNLISLSLVLTLWSSSTGIAAIIIGLNKAYDENEKRAFYVIWAIRVVGVVVLALIITLSFVLLIFGSTLGDYMQCCYKLSNTIRALWDILRIFLSIVILILVFSAAYYFLPSRKLKWKEVLPGSVFSTFGWMISSFAFSYYVNNFANYSRFYGSIGAVFALMTWLYISCEIILLGGELNASLIHNRV